MFQMEREWGVGGTSVRRHPREQSMKFKGSGWPWLLLRKLTPEILCSEIYGRWSYVLGTSHPAATGHTWLDAESAPKLKTTNHNMRGRPWVKLYPIEVLHIWWWQTQPIRSSLGKYNGQSRCWFSPTGGPLWYCIQIKFPRLYHFDQIIKGSCDEQRLRTSR